MEVTGMPEIEVKNYMPAQSHDNAALIAAMSGNRGGDGLFGGGNGGGLLGGLLFGSLLTGGGLGGMGGWGRGVGGPAAAAVATDVVLNPAFQSLQNQISNLTTQTSDAAMINEANANARLLSTQIGDVSTAQAAGNFTTLQSINGLGATVTAQNNQNALQQLNSFNQLNTSILQSFNESSRDNANAFNQVQGSLAAMAAQQAACCCDLKSTIAADGAATRALINDLHVQDLQSQLNDAKLQISNTNQTLALEQFIATHPAAK